MVQCPLLCGRIASSLTSSRPPGSSNSSTASSPVTSSSAASSERQPLGFARLPDRQPRRGCEHLVADPVALHGLHDRVDGALAVRRAGHQRGQLPVESDVLLGEHRDGVAEHRRRLVRRAAYPHAAAVVAAGDRLEHDRPAAPAARIPSPRPDRRPARNAGRARRARSAAPASPACPGCGGARRPRAGPPPPAPARPGARQARAHGRRSPRRSRGRTRAGLPAGCSHQPARRHRPGPRCRPPSPRAPGTRCRG